MKLSEVMRKGNLFPQIRGRYIRYDTDKKICGICALGAVILGQVPSIDDETTWGSQAEIGGYFAPFGIYTDMCTYPITGEEQSLIYVITHLNDNDGWTIEQIADWLESEGR